MIHEQDKTLAGLAIGIVIIALIFILQSTYAGPGPAVSCAPLDQASFGLDTAGCPTAAGALKLREERSWEFETSPVTPFLMDPQETPFLYDIKVLQAAGERTLLVSGQMIVSNKGQATGILSTVSASLEANGASTPSSKMLLTDADGNAVSAVYVPPSKGCADATTLNFVAEFDIGELSMRPGDSAGLELAGVIGNHESCSQKSDIGLTQTLGFTVPPASSVCPEVTITKSAQASDTSCVRAAGTTSSKTLEAIPETGVAMDHLTGTASCIKTACSAEIVPSYEVHCSDGHDELIKESAPQSITVVCN